MSWYSSVRRTSRLSVLLICALWMLSACTDSSTTEVNNTELAEAPTIGGTGVESEAGPSSLESYQGLPVGFTAEGYPYLGSPDAPITIIEYSDYQCPFCARYTMETEPAVKENYARTGQVKIIFRDFPLTHSHPNANAASVAALCVAEQGAAPFWQMHAQLFRTQESWSSQPDPSDHFRQLAEAAGVDLDAYRTCTEQGKTQPLIDRSLAEGRSLGFSATPSFQFLHTESGKTFQLVGAHPYDVLADWIQVIAGGGSPVDPQEAQRNPEQEAGQQVPFWASAEGLTPDPDRPGYNMAGDQYRGDPKAPLVVVEFSDFQCPFCRQHAIDTQPILDQEFVEPGKVMWVFKHFPVESTHPQSMAASMGAECAAEQGKFWEMHDLLFERVSQWSVREPQSVLATLAEELSLNTEVFNRCMVDDTIRQRVESDRTDGAPYVRGTPSFVILVGGRGQIIPGALPAGQFRAALKQVAAESGVPIE